MSLSTICHDTQDIFNNIDAIKKEAHRKVALRFAISENESGVECVEQDLSSLGYQS